MVTLEGLKRLYDMINSKDEEMVQLGIKGTLEYLNIHVPDVLAEEYGLKGICGAEIAHRAYKLGKEEGKNYLKQLLDGSVKNTTETEQGVIC